MIKDFECVKCGNCCRYLSVTLVELGEIGSEINKPCKYLDENNLCKIYESKPEVCNNFPTSLFYILKCSCKGKRLI